MHQGTRRLAAIMFTDMVGYTALGQKDESLSLLLLDDQRKLVRSVLPRHEGREVKTIGDAFLVEFSSALNAVRCAYDIQRTVREFNFSLPEERRIHLRVGIHLGDVVESEGDVSGDAVNVASRIEPLAEDGGVCLTGQVFHSVIGKFEVQMESTGEQSLKNVAVPIEVFKMVMPWAKETAGNTKGSLRADRVAILPFRNMSPDPNDEYFAEGLTEELISTIAKINELTVISRTSVMRYRNLSVPISQIGVELQVGSVLEGSVRKAGNKVRITCQLIDVRTDGHIWSASYDKELTDIFGIQGDIAGQVADSLKIQLVSGELRLIQKKATTDIGAYTLYLKGRHYWNERTNDGTRKALAYFKEAVKADPAFAMAYSGISDCYNILSDYTWMEPNEALPLAKANATKALEIDDTLAEAHASLGLTLSNYDWDLDGAERELRRAIELKPNYAPAHHWYAVILFFMRRYQESEEPELHALEHDPYSRTYNMACTNRLLIAKGPEGVLNKYEELIETYPDFPAIRFWKSIAHVLAGENEKALLEARKFVELDGRSWPSMLNLGWVYASAGSVPEAETILQEAIAAYEKSPVGPTNIAQLELTLGHNEEGYAWLQRAYNERDPQLLYFNGYPWTKRFRKDPKWSKIEARLRLKSVPD